MLSLKSVGFSTSRLHTVHIVLSDNGCDKCICSLSESSNVISVVSKAQWKPYILKCMKSQKSNVCYQHIGKCLALVFCRTVFVSWWRVYLLASSCLNWCLVEHSSVKMQRHLLVCLFLTHLLSHKTPPPPHPPPPPPPQKRAPVLVLARMFTMSSFSFCVRKFRTLCPLLSPALQEFV